MILTIDCINKEGHIQLGNTKRSITMIDQNRHQQLLVLIEKMMNDMGVTTKDITKIVVNPGPGSFTSVRVATTVANMLAKSWNVPLETGPNQQVDLVLPIYSEPPKITKKAL